MKLRRRLGLFLLCLTLLCSGGCGTMLKGDYLVVQPHKEAEETPAGENEIPEVGTDQALKAAILDLVLEGKEYGVIRLADFATDEVEAMSVACWEVKSASAFGAYAVDYITHDYTRILSYYDMEVYITYRRSQEQIDSLLALSTPSLVRAALRSAVRGYDDYVAISVSDSSIDEAFIRDYVETYYYSNPMYILTCPQMEIYTYPDTGVKRILEAFLTYPYTSEEMSQRIGAVNQEGRAILNDILRGDEALYALDICRALTGRTEYLPAEAEGEEPPDRSGSAYTAYGALLEGQANSEGYAMAYKLLCDLAGIDCQVVLGRLDGAEHAWNIIQLDGESYHVDPSMCDENGYFSAFLCNDGQMFNHYWWDTKEYPACTGSLSYAALTGEPEAPAEESTAPTENPEPTPEPSGEIDEEVA